MQYDINNLPKKIPKEQFWGIIQGEVWTRKYKPSN